MWPLLRSQCARVLRRTQLRALSSTARLTQAATVSLRLSHSTVETTNVPPAVDGKDFPIDVMDRQLAIRSLTGHIKKKQWNQASKQLEDILTSSPGEFDWQLFQQLYDIIVWTNPEKPNLSLAVDLGVAAASKGRSDFSRKQIMPLIERYGTAKMWEDFDSQISGLTEHEPQTGKSKQLFESADDDYAAAAPIVMTRQPSIQEVVEQSLPATLPQPIDGDASLFEDAVEAEYSHFVSQEYSLKHSLHSSVGFLNKLIAEDKYEQAYELLMEMKELGVIIPPNKDFALIARTVVEKGEALVPEELSDRLLSWLSLVPERSRVVLEELTTIAGHLSDTTWFRVSLLMRVTLIYASKGYIIPIKPMLNVICHGVRDRELRNFIQEYESVYLAYWERSTPENPQYLDAFIADTRNTVIRILGGTGRHMEIESYLPLDGRYKLWPSTYAHVLLYPMSEETKKCVVQMLSKLKGEKNNQETLRKVKVQSLEEPADFANDLAAGLKYMKRSLASKVSIPHPHTISSFMDAYLSTGRSKGLQIVFDRALKGNRAVARTFLLGEMLFYRRLQHYDLVIETFVNHFLLMSVPSEQVLSKYREALDRRLNYNPDSGEQPPLRRFYQFDKDAFLGKKLIPLTLHCNLVWDALIATSSRPLVGQLYQQFLHEAHRRDPQMSPKESDSFKKDTLATPMVQSSSFVSFLRPLMSLNGAEAGSQIIKDILNLRLSPHKYIYTEVAGAYAREGKVDEAFDILFQLESRKLYSHSPRNGIKMMFRPPAPDFVFYVALLKGFIMSRNVEAAEEIVRRVENKFKPERGQNFKYDQALECLKDLKSRASESQISGGHLQKPS